MLKKEIFRPRRVLLSTKYEKFSKKKKKEEEAQRLIQTSVLELEDFDPVFG